jgi:hypothetical protein
MTVRADPGNHERIAVSLTEPTPVVPINDPAVLDPPAHAGRGDVALMAVGAKLPARRLAAEPNVLAIDWAAAERENPVAGAA